MPKLTKKYIDGVPSPASGQVFYRDTQQPGFSLRVTPGSKSFTFEKRIHGRSRRLTLGPYPGLTVEQARTLAREKLGDIAKGKDPADEHRTQRQQLPTFGELTDMYLLRHASRKKSWRNDDGLLRNHLAHWRSRTLASLTRDEIARLHTKIGTEPSSVIRPGKPVSVPMPRAANALLALLHSMFALASDWGLFTGPNPAVRIKKFPAISRDRFVTPSELPRLWKALANEPNPFVKSAFVVGTLVGARRSEILSMKWSDLDLQQSLWRIPDTKAGRPHVIPLPRPVLEELLKLPRIHDNPYVFCGRWGKSHLVNVSKPWKRIRKEAGLNDVRIHDLRRTLGSWLVAAGASLPLIGRALNHTSVQTTAIYSRMELGPVRLALEQNAQKMLTVIEAAQHNEQAVTDGKA